MPQFRSVLEYTGILVLALCSLAAVQTPVLPHPTERTSVQDIDTRMDEAAKPVADTLTYIVQAGEVLIFNLPELLNGKTISDYQIKRSPALSWLVKRSFFWRTLATDVGEHEILLDARMNGRVVESLVIEVEIR